MSACDVSEGRGWSSWGTGRKAAAIAGGTIGGLGLAALFGFVIMWLWNWLMPHIFGLPAIGYWEGWGLLILSSILFKGTGGGKGGGNSEERKRKRIIRERMNEACDEGGEADARPGNAAEEPGRA